MQGNKYRTPLRDAAIELLKECGPLDCQSIAQLLAANERSLWNTLKKALALKLVHVHDWERQDGPGIPRPIYKAGPGKNKPRPAPIPRSETNRRYQRKHAAALKIGRIVSRDAPATPVWLRGLVDVKERA